MRRVLTKYFEDAAASVQAAILFGSHATGRTHTQSDVDVAVLLDRRLYPERNDRSGARVQLTTDLIGQLHQNEIDVVILNDVPPLFARHILQTGLHVHVADALALRAFQRDVLLRAADVEPFVQRGRRRILEVLQR